MNRVRVHCLLEGSVGFIFEKKRETVKEGRVCAHSFGSLDFGKRSLTGRDTAVYGFLEEDVDLGPR